MNDQKPMDSRRARYLIAAGVLVLIILVGAAYFIIVGVRGDEADTGPGTPTSDVVPVPAWALTGPGR